MPLQRIKALSYNDFVRNVSTVGGSIALVQAINLIAMPFITRLYGPESFGTAAAFFSILTILTPIATLGYANAIALPEHDNDALAIVRLSLISGLAISFTSLIVIFIGKPWFAKWLHLTLSSDLLYLIPMSLLMTSLGSVAGQLATREGFFKQKSLANIESSILINVFKVIGGNIAPSGLLLIIFNIVSQILNFALQIFHLPKNNLFKFKLWMSTQGTRQAATTYYDFAVYRMPQSILNASAVGLPVILLTSLFGSSASGQYSLAVSILGVPTMLLGQAVGEVFYPKISRAIATKSHQSSQMLLKVSAVLLILGIIPFGLIMLFGSWLTKLIFGNQWQLAGQYAMILAPWMLMVLVSGVSTAAAPALKLQRFLLIREIFSVLLRALALYIGFYFYHSSIIAVSLFSAVSIVLSLSIIFVVFKRLYKVQSSW